MVELYGYYEEGEELDIRKGGCCIGILLGARGFGGRVRGEAE